MKQSFLICLGLAIITAFLYSGVGEHEFISFDDDKYVENNRHVNTGLSLENIIWAFTNPAASNWHPITWISHMTDCQVWGLDAGPHHLTNLAIHLANTILLFLVLRSMTGATWRSAFVAAVFAWHPLHVESVAWIAERKDLLSGLFWMLTLAAYTEYVRKKSFGYYLLVVLCLALGLMSKPMLVTLPFVLLLLDYWPLNRFRGPQSSIQTLRTAVWEKLPLFALVAASCVVTFIVQRDSGAVQGLESIPLGLRLQNASVAYITYLMKMVWPSNLALFYPMPDSFAWWQVAGSLGLLLGISALAIYCTKSRPYLAVGWFWYLGTLVPVIGFVQVGIQSMADRYMYLPMTGILLAATWGISDMVKQLKAPSWMLPVTATILLAGMAMLTKIQIGYWKDSQTLYERTLAVTRKNYQIHNNLGLALVKMKRFQEGIAQYREALLIQPNHIPTHNNLGVVMEKMGDIPQALRHYREALRIDADHARLHTNLGRALEKSGKTEESTTHFERAIELDAEHDEALTRLALARQREQRMDEAIELYRRALEVNPENLYAVNNLAWIFATHPDPRFRNGQEAIRLAEKACGLKEEEDPSALDTLAAAYAEAGRFDEAVAAAEKALTLSPPGENNPIGMKIRTRIQLYQNNQPLRDTP